MDPCDAALIEMFGVVGDSCSLAWRPGCDAAYLVMNSAYSFGSIYGSNSMDAKTTRIDVLAVY